MTQNPRCSLCTRSSTLTHLIGTDPEERAIICAFCQELIQARAATEAITPWHVYTLLTQRLSNHLGLTPPLLVGNR